MPHSKDLRVPYHQQDTDYYCGAACAQMVLAEMGAGLLGQEGLYTENHNHSTTEPGWYTAPDGLQWTLNHRRPHKSHCWFGLFALASSDAISRKIAWTIHHFRVAPVALVYGSAHWIVIRGFDASGPPAHSGDSGYSISAFIVNNPWPPVPTTPPFPPPPPHSPHDGCGTGGMRGVADEHVSYATWLADYMTGVPSGYWQGKFVAVCDPESPPDKLGEPAPAPQLVGDEVLSPQAARDLAVKGLTEHGLFERDPWKKSLAKTHPGDPVLVQRLDRVDSLYYIVPMLSARKAAPVLASIDARFGNYKQAVNLTGRSGSALAELNFDAKSAREKILERSIELEEPLGHLLVRKEAHVFYPTLVWKPCRESFSPFYPFHMVIVGDHRIYIRVDGAVFTALHDQDRGL